MIDLKGFFFFPKQINPDFRDFFTFLIKLIKMSSDSPRTFNANASNKKFTQSMNTNNGKNKLSKKGERKKTFTRSLTITLSLSFSCIGRNSHTRQRLLSTKISAPLPINLPSLKSESGTDGPAAHNWGPSTATNPEITHVQPIELPVSRAWAVPSSSPSPPRLEVSGTSKVISNSKALFFHAFGHFIF